MFSGGSDHTHMGFSHKLSAVVLVVLFWTGALLADLQSDIKRILADRLLQKTTTAVEVVRLAEKPGDCQVIYERNSRAPLTPASNMKILTTSAALHVLTPQFRFRTMLVRHDDDLVIWGDGDPSLGDAELMETIGWSQTAVFDDWANQLKKRQIATVRNIVVDDSIYDQEFLHPRWEKHQFTPSGAEVGGLNFAANTIEFTVQRKGDKVSWLTKPATSYVRVATNTASAGQKNTVILGRLPATNVFSLRGTIDSASVFSATIHDPGLYAGNVLSELLKSREIAVSGEVVRDLQSRQKYASADAATRDQLWQVLCIFETPLPAVITRCNKDSMNVYAESLSKRMGASAGGSGSWQSGEKVVGDFIKMLGVAETEFHLDDGSGLSRDNTVSVNAIIRCLIHNYYSPNRQLFIDSLPIGGVDGTLKKRFAGSLRGRVFAKTGFIANVSALSGYVKTGRGDWYAFSILMNNIPNLSNSSIKPLQDKIVEAIDQAAGAN